MGFVKRWLAIALIIGAMLIGGCLPQLSNSQSSASPSLSPTETATAIADAQANLPKLDGKATVEMFVKGGTVTIEIDGTNAPITAGNFIDLVQRKVYDGLVFHRVERDPQPFVVQGGDPESKDTNFPAADLGKGSFIDPATSRPRYIPLEIKPQGTASPIYHQTLKAAGISASPKLRHTRGAVAMARSSLPDSASSQFYIALSDLSFLDGDYAVFGYVTQGMETVDKIQQGDRIESIKIITGKENLKKGEGDTSNWFLTKSMRILLVDDEAEMVDPLSRILVQEGYEVDVAHDGDRGSLLAQQNRYDLLVLDWMLPHCSGLELCQQLRSQGITTPVLFLTAKDTIGDRVLGLDAGADDYLVKPFELRELLARVRALLRRPVTSLETLTQSLHVGDLELDPDNQLAYRHGREIELSEKEVQLLAYLMRYPNQLLTHEQIHQHLWGNSAEKPTSNALAAQIRLLRRKIESAGESPLINTVYGKGYRFGSATVKDRE